MRQLVSTVIVLGLVCLPQTVWALVNINTASSAELQTLTGIGTVIAGRIVDYRNQVGLFQSVEAIKNVTGIGDATYEKIKNDITISGATTVTTTAETTSNTSSSFSGTYVKGEKKVFIPVSGLVLTAPGIGYVNQPVHFNVSPEDGTNDRLVRYTWNFGDGSIANQKNPIHHYKYPGTYVVTVESYYLKEVKSTRYELTIFPINLNVTTNSSGKVSIHNAGQYEIDLHGMTLKGEKDFIFPKYTILLPDKTLTLKNSSQNPVRLFDNLGHLVTTQNKPANLPVASRSSGVAVSKQVSIETSPEIEINGPYKDPTSSSGSAGNKNTAAVASSNIPTKAWPYLGLIGLIFVGLLAVYGTKRPV